MSLSLLQLLPANVFVVALIACRVGVALSLLPGFGASYIPTQIKIVLTVLIAFIMTPIVAATIPPLPKDVAQLTGLIVIEGVVGAFIGLYANLLLAALDFAGGIIAMQSSLSSAITFNPGEQKQETLPASLLSAIAVVMIFATNMHYVFISAILQSYQMFPPGAALPIGDFADALARIVERGFEISLQIAAPYLIMGTIFHVALGLIGRIMPQLQIFYVALPLQVLGGLALLLVTVPASIMWFMNVLDGAFASFGHLQ